MQNHFLFFIVAYLIIGLQTNAFAQISSTANVEIKDIPNVMCYPKNTDIAIIDDRTSIVFSEVTVDGLYRNAFHLVQEGNISVRQIMFADNFEVRDIDVFENTLFFSGFFRTSLTSSDGFVAWADINDFFDNGIFYFKRIEEVGIIDKVKPYLNGVAEINLACLGGGCVIQVDVASDNYKISKIDTLDDYREMYHDIIVYDKYILVSGYINYLISNMYGWSIRMYDKNDISQSVPYKNVYIISNWGSLTYTNISDLSFLIKSKDEKKLCLATRTTAQVSDESTANVLSVFDFCIDYSGSLNYIIDGCGNRFDIVSPIPVSMLWDVDLCYGMDYNYDIVMLTYDGGNYASVFNIGLNDPVTNGCNIFTNSYIGMFSSIKTYNDHYFISAGDLQWDLGLWDRNISITSNYCDVYDYTDVLQSTPRIRGEYIQFEVVENNVSWELYKADILVF